jgi:hypothetical protein
MRYDTRRINMSAYSSRFLPPAYGIVLHHKSRQNILYCARSCCTKLKRLAAVM